MWAFGWTGQRNLHVFLAAAGPAVPVGSRFSATTMSTFFGLPMGFVVPRPRFENTIFACFFEMRTTAMGVPSTAVTGDGLELVAAGRVGLSLVRMCHQSAPSVATNRRNFQTTY